MASEAATKTYTFRVGMTCVGCENAVKRLVGKVDGVASMETDVAQKKLVVTGTCSADDVIAKLTPWASNSNKELSLVSSA